MSGFLVVSNTHHLLPFAHRLEREGHEVHPIVVVRQFEASWHGKLKPSPRKGGSNRKEKDMLDESFLKDTFAEAVANDWTVLTDSIKLEPRMREEFGVSPKRLYGRCRLEGGEPKTPLRIGGWFDGETLQHMFGAVVDRGAWHSGFGPDVDGAVTLIRIDNDAAVEFLQTMLVEDLAELKAQEFQGIVHFGIEFQTESGNPEVVGVGAGWPMLITHGFLSELENLGTLLSSDHRTDLNDPLPQATVQPLPKKFVTVLPVSRPPWPTAKAKFRFSTELIEGLTPTQTSRVFWHDIQVDQGVREMRTAGLDGLVGVVRGAADTSELSRLQALEIATLLKMPEKQFRADAGQQVQLVLSQLERLYGLLL